MKPLLLIPHKAYSSSAVSFAATLAGQAAVPLSILYVGKQESHQKIAEEIFAQAGELLSDIKFTTEFILGGSV